MSSRDWSTIGTGGRSPRWVRWALLPPILPLAAFLWLCFGHPAVTARSHHLYGFLIFGAGLSALITGMMTAIWYGSQRSMVSELIAKMAIAIASVLSVIFTAIGLSGALRITPWWIPAGIPIAAIGLVIFLARKQSELEQTAGPTPDECWSLNGIYYNPSDPSLFVPARVGYGMTLNMGHRWARRILFGFFGGIALLAGFLVWSLR